MYELCFRLAGNRADALDATQEALITVARRIGRFDGRSAFSTWLYRVTTNACLDELRRRSRRPQPVDPTDLVDAEPVARTDPSATVDDRLTLDQALATLPEPFRVAVVLRDVLTLDYAEMATVLDVPIGTVRSRLARGRSLLARRLADDGNPQPGPRRPIPRPPGSDDTTHRPDSADPAGPTPSRAVHPQPAPPSSPQGPTT